MSTQIQHNPYVTEKFVAATFTAAERQALRVLRTHYAQTHDFFSTSELARLRFLRWLVQTGRLDP